MDKMEMIGQRIREARETSGLTQEELGLLVGLNKSTIQRYESGKISRIKPPVLDAIAEELHVNPNYLKLATDDPIDYEDPLLTQDAPLDIIEHCNGNNKKIYKAMEAIEDDRRAENGVVSIPILPQSKGKIHKIVVSAKGTPERTFTNKNSRFRHIGGTLRVEETFPRFRRDREQESEQVKQAVKERTALIYGDPRTTDLLMAFKELNDTGRTEAVKRVTELTQIDGYKDKEE